MSEAGQAGRHRYLPFSDCLYFDQYWSPREESHQVNYNVVYEHVKKTFYKKTRRWGLEIHQMIRKE